MLNLDKKHEYLLACSYGPDSMALFSMLIKEGYKFSAAIVNYHLRIESNDEVKLLKEYCSKNGIRLFIHDVQSNLGKNNIEKKCRDIRYKYFASLINDYGFKAVLVAHHQDDLIETYIIQKRRKTLVNYYGIKENSIINGVNVSRPLLSYTKDQLLNYCVKNSIPFSIDKTNLESDFLRNRIRHDIVEKMTKEERKDILNNIKKDNVILDEIFASIGDASSSKIIDYNRLNETEFAYALVVKGRKLKSDFKISKKQCSEIRKVLLSNKSNAILAIDGLLFYKSYDSFMFEKEGDVSFSYILKEPCKLNTPFFYLDFTNGASNRHIGSSSYPLLIRNAQKNDVYTIKEYKKTVRRLFIDWKMPLRLRKRWPVIIDKEGEIVYIPRYQKDFVITENCNFYVKL